MRVLITGGARGLGLALAKLIAQDGEAAQIFILGEDRVSLDAAKQEIQALGTGSQVHVLVADLRDFALLQQLMLQVVISLNMVICAHNTVPFGSGVKFQDMGAEQLRFMVDSNLLGSLHVLAAVHPLVTKNRHSVVALVSSQAAQAGVYGHTVVSSTQSALQGLAEAYRQELLPLGVQVSIAYPPLFLEQHEMTGIARQILNGVKSKHFSISCGSYGRLLRLVNAGMSPQPSIRSSIADVLLMGVARLASFGILSREYRQIAASHGRKRFDKKLVPLKGSRVLITGGSSGIGLALAKCFSSEGAIVSILGRDTQRLEAAKREAEDFSGQVIHTISADVTKYESVSKALQELGPLDVVVCSHGVAIPTTLEDATTQGLKLMTDTNLVGTLNVVHAALPGLKMDRSNGCASVVLLSSQAGQVGMYGYCGYSATKFSLRGFAQSLDKEEFMNNIQVSLVYPPDTRTPGLESENLTKPEITKALSASSGTMDAMEVARKALDGIKRGQFTIACNLEGLLLAFATAGMSPQSHFLSASAEVMLMPFLRLAGLSHVRHWDKTVLSLA